jgi:hypothetical protein
VSVAPEMAPRRDPNSSRSASSFGSVAQLTAENGPFDLGLES